MYVFFIRRPRDANMPGHVFIGPQIHISQNTAQIAGNDICGGWIEAYYHTLILVLWMLPENELHGINYFKFNRVCILCIWFNEIPACSIFKSVVSLFPGPTFNTTAVVVDQRMGTFPSVVIAKLSDSEGRLRQEQNIQSADKWCSTLIFTVHSENKLVDLNIDAHWQDIGTLYKIYLQHLLPPKYFALLEHYSMNIILKDCDACSYNNIVSDNAYLKLEDVNTSNYCRIWRVWSYILYLMPTSHSKGGATTWNGCGLASQSMHSLASKKCQKHAYCINFNE